MVPLADRFGSVSAYSCGSFRRLIEGIEPAATDGVGPRLHIVFELKFRAGSPRWHPGRCVVHDAAVACL